MAVSAFILSCLVVVAPAAWHSELEDYVRFRRQHLEVELVALEDTAEEEGRDAAERLKRYLFRAWKERGARYALLVGDADVLPVRFNATGRRVRMAFDTAFYATDLYYADVAREDGSFDDWNGRADAEHGAYFGEVRGQDGPTTPINFDRVSYLPEVAVGRWPVSDAKTARAVADKTLGWEERVAAQRTGGPRALLVHAAGWVDARERIARAGGRLQGSGWWVQEQFFAGERPPTPRGVAAAIREADLVVHAGHGSKETWQRCLGVKEREGLRSAPPAIFLSVGCDTARFSVQAPYTAYVDVEGVAHPGTQKGEVFTAPPPQPAPVQPAEYAATGLGERLLRMPTGGAVVYIGCNTGSQPCSLSLLDGVLRSVAKGARRIGDVWSAALRHYWKVERLATLKATGHWYPPAVFHQGMKFMLLGDPTSSLPEPLRPAGGA